MEHRIICGGGGGGVVNPIEIEKYEFMSTSTKENRIGQKQQEFRGFMSGFLVQISSKTIFLFQYQSFISMECLYFG